MRTFRASAIAVVAVCRATAFNFYPRQFQSSLKPASHHSFCSRTSSYDSATSSRQHSEVRCRDKRARARRSSGGASLHMFDATDLFQLQQWAGDISATEVRRCDFSSASRSNLDTMYVRVRTRTTAVRTRRFQPGYVPQDKVSRRTTKKGDLDRAHFHPYDMLL